MPLTKSNRTSPYLLSLIALVLFLALPGISAADDDDPPGRVARLNLIQGSVSFQPAGTQDWVEANPNRPLTTGDQLWADQDSRGELHIGSTAIRISDHTGLSFLNLTDNVVQIQVAQGTADFRIVHMYDNETYEIDTANLAFTILRPGEYRVDVNQDGTQSIVTVRNGAGEVTAGGQAYKLDGGQQYIFSGTDQVNYDAESLPDPDGFDSWCRDRDHREDNSQSARYISRDVIGYDDLDTYGTWRTDPTYGPVWVPSGVAVGWAPYHTGHWAYVAPWGWTWVDDAPWGFAPFHYGRWAYVGSSWAWVPGPVAVVGVGGPRVGVAVGWGVRPVYAPALVGFVGGGGFSAAIAIGGGAGVAWVPLGPRDVWVPGYHCSPAYMNNVNVTSSRVVNRTQITNVYNTTVVNRTTVVNNVTVNKVVYSNQSAPGAVTAVPQKSFQSGQSVAASAVKVAPEQISNPKVVAAKPVDPTPEAVKGPSRPAPVSARPPATVVSRPVVTKMTPSPKAIPVGHTQPLTTAQYRPASQPGARPNTNFKAGSQPANAGKPVNPANAAANKPANNAEAAKPANPGNPAANKPANNAEAAKPVNPPVNENRAAQPPNKFSPPPHNANPGVNNDGNPNTKPNPEAARNPNAAAPPPPNKFTPPPSHNVNPGVNNDGNPNTKANPEAARNPNAAAAPPKPATPPPSHTNANRNEESAKPPAPPSQKPAPAARVEPRPEPRNEPHNEPKPEAKKPPNEQPKDKHPDKH
jgi:hypothetical protein